MSDPPAADAPQTDPQPAEPSSSQTAAAAPTAPTTTTTTTTTTTSSSRSDPTAPGSRKPRDARIIHLILASLGVHSYHERVPLMLLDFAYRYTSAVLQDALLFSDAINNTTNTGGQNPPAVINSDDLRMSIASRVNHQFSSGLPKEFLLDIAQERNRVALPTVGPEFGVRLPPEKYCLTGVNWDLKEGWEEWEDGEDDEEEDEEEDEEMGDTMNVAIKSEPNGEDEDKMDVEDLFGGDDGAEGNDVDSSMMDA